MRRWMGPVAAAVLLGACQAQPSQKALNQTAEDAAGAQLTARAAQATAAADQFAAAASGAAVSGQAPRQSDPQTARLLDAVFDTSAIPETTRTIVEARALETWSAAAEKVARIYLGAGAGPDPAPGDALSAQADRNLVTYAPELGRYVDTTVVLASRDGATIEIFEAINRLDEDNTEKATEHIQAVARSGYGGALDFLARKTPSDAWKEARAAVLARMVSRIGGSLQPWTAHALQTRALALAAQTDDPVLKAQLKLFAAKL